MTTPDRLTELVHRFSKQTVLGIGDLILDQYRRGHANGLSPEAPAIDLLNPDLTETPGGAANVAWNIGHLGGHVRMIGVVGRDAEAQSLRRLLEATPGVTLITVEDPSRPTTLKLRFYHQQFQILRVNQESKEPLAAAVAHGSQEALQKHLEGCSALFVEDYGKGIVTPTLIDLLRALHRERSHLPIILDPKIGNHTIYRSGMCTLLKPNWNEACQLLGEDSQRADRAHIAYALSERFDCDVCITLGIDGALLLERTVGTPVTIPTRPREAYDVAGAGDTTLAVITLALATGASLVEAAVLANIAGGIVVQKSGTSYVTPEEIFADLLNPATKPLLKPLEI